MMQILLSKKRDSIKELKIKYIEQNNLLNKKLNKNTPLKKNILFKRKKLNIINLSDTQIITDYRKLKKNRFISFFFKSYKDKILMTNRLNKYRYYLNYQNILKYLYYKKDNNKTIKLRILNIDKKFVYFGFMGFIIKKSIKIILFKGKNKLRKKFSKNRKRFLHPTRILNFFLKLHLIKYKIRITKIYKNKFISRFKTNNIISN